MRKTIENLKSGNYEVVDNQGVSVTTHFIECLEKEFADLEAKLDEIQNEKDELISKYRYWKGECAELKEQLARTEKAFDLMSIVLCTGARDDLKRQLGRFTLRQEVKDFFLKQAEQEVENE